MVLLKQVFRRLMHERGFTAVTLAILAVGTSATAICSVLIGVLLKPLPHFDVDRLISMNHQAPGVGMFEFRLGPFRYFIEREYSETLESVGLWARAPRA